MSFSRSQKSLNIFPQPKPNISRAFPKIRPRAQSVFCTHLPRLNAHVYAPFCMAFQSTPPAREATNACASGSRVSIVSIHALAFLRIYRWRCRASRVQFVHSGGGFLHSLSQFRCKFDATSAPGAPVVHCSGRDKHAEHFLKARCLSAKAERRTPTLRSGPCVAWYSMGKGLQNPLRSGNVIPEAVPAADSNSTISV